MKKNVAPYQEMGKPDRTSIFAVMLRILSQLTAYVLHPLLAFFYTVVLVAILKPHLFGVVHWAELHVLLMLIAVNAVVLPLAGITLLKWIGFIKSFELSNAHERYVPLIVCSVFYLWMWLNLKSQQQVPKILLAFMLGAILSMFFAFVFNIRIKVSLHTLAFGCMVCFWFLLRYYHCEDNVMHFRFEKAQISSFHLHRFMMLLLPLAGWVGTSRLALLTHTQEEVYLGYFLGAAAMSVAYQYTF